MKTLAAILVLAAATAAQAQQEQGQASGRSVIPYPTPDAFAAIDRDNDGRLSVPEVRGHPELTMNFTIVDRNRDQVLNWQEYLNAIELATERAGDGPIVPDLPQQQRGRQQPLPSDERVVEGGPSNTERWRGPELQGQRQGEAPRPFDYLDENNDGYLSAREAGVEYGLDWQQADTDRDGRISHSEFAAFREMQREEFREQRGGPMQQRQGPMPGMEPGPGMGPRDGMGPGPAPGQGIGPGPETGPGNR